MSAAAVSAAMLLGAAWGAHATPAEEADELLHENLYASDNRSVASCDSGRDFPEAMEALLRIMGESSLCTAQVGHAWIRLVALDARGQLIVTAFRRGELYRVIAKRVASWPHVRREAGLDPPVSMTMARDMTKKEWNELVVATRSIADPPSHPRPGARTFILEANIDGRYDVWRAAAPAADEPMGKSVALLMRSLWPADAGPVATFDHDAARQAMQAAWSASRTCFGALKGCWHVNMSFHRDGTGYGAFVMGELPRDVRACVNAKLGMVWVRPFVEDEPLARHEEQLCVAGRAK